MHRIHNMAGLCYAALDSGFKCRVGGIFLLCSITHKLLTKVKEWKQSKASSAQLKSVPETCWAASPWFSNQTGWRQHSTQEPWSPWHPFLVSPSFSLKQLKNPEGFLASQLFSLPPSEVTGARWGLVLWALGLFPKAKNVCIDANSLDHVQENLVHCLSVDLASHQE